MAGDDVTIAIRANNGQALRAFRDTEGRLRDMRGRFVSEGRLMSGAMNQVASSIGGVVGGPGGGGLMSLKAAAIGAGAAVGVSLLPAIGAAVPAAAGLGVAIGTLKLGFAGVSDAMEAAGKGKKEYAEALKKLSPQARDFTRAMVDLKDKFSGVGKEIQKEMLPGFTKAVKAANPVVKILGSSMTDLGGAFGDAAEGFGRMMKDSGFQKDLQANLKMGTGAVKDLTSSLGPLVKSFLDFGAKSKPTLDALTGFATGIATTGLPGFFKGLEPGIAGSAKVIEGLGYALNEKLLPALGRFSGAFADAMGPLLGESFKLLGDVGAGILDTLAGGLRTASPLLKDLAEGLRAVRDVGSIIAPTMQDVGRAIADAFLPGDIGEGPFKKLAGAIERNKGTIQEAARIAGEGILTMVQVGVSSLPLLIEAFRLASAGIIVALDGIVSGAAAAFGWIPGIGDKLKTANRAFDEWSGAYLDSLGTAQRKAEEFAASTSEKLSEGKLKLDINNWNAQIKTAKEQLAKVPPEKRAALKARIDDLRAKVAEAQRKLDALDGKKATTWIYTNVRTTYSTARSVSGGKSVHEMVGATGGMFTGRGFRHGYADGGLVSGPGTGTSDDVFAPWLSNGEFVMKAAAVRKYGEKFMQALNEGRLTMPRFASGGKVSSEARDARSSLRGQFGISSFGRLAGYQRTPFEKSLGAPSDVPALVDALNRASGDIKRATGGRTESRLLRQLNSVGKTLITYDKQLNKVNSSLEKARGKLDDLKSAAAQLSDSVKSNILSSANITRAAGAEDSRVTINTILSQMRGSASNAAEFDSALKALRKKGLSSDLLSQIAQAGVEGGGLETAQALLGGSSDQIRTLNSLQNQIAKSAASAGATTADAVYGGAIKAQAAYVSMLAKSQDRLEKAMANLAKVMEKAISKAIGRKAAGGIVGGAASGGVRGGMTWVGEQGPELLDLPAGARVWSSPDSRRMASAPWASMLTTRHGRPSYPRQAAAGGRREPIELVIRSGGSKMDDLLVEVIRKAVHHRGGVQAAFGKL